MSFRIPPIWIFLIGCTYNRCLEEAQSKLFDHLNDLPIKGEAHIAIDLVIAWRVMLLTLLGREVPEMPCELFFSAWECTLLKQLQPLGAPETLRGQKKLGYVSARPV